MPHPGASAPESRNAQFRSSSPWYTKLATGFLDTTHLPASKVDSHILIVGESVKSSKKMCGVPDASITRAENCVLVSVPLTSAGAEKGCPGPGDWDTRIAEPNAGIVAVPSVQGEALQKYV